MRKMFFIIAVVLVIILMLIMKVSNKNGADKGYVSIENNQELVIENILPLTDDVGSSFSRSNIYYKFKIKSNVDKKVNYKILLGTNKGKKFIKDDYIKILLSDKDNNTLKEKVKKNLFLDCGFQMLLYIMMNLYLMVSYLSIVIRRIYG